MSHTLRSRLDSSARVIKVLEQVFPPDVIVTSIQVYLPTIATVEEWTSATNEMLEQVESILDSSRTAFLEALENEPAAVVDGMDLETFDGDVQRVKSMIDIVRNRMAA